MTEEKSNLENSKDNVEAEESPDWYFKTKIYDDQHVLAGNANPPPIEKQKEILTPLLKREIKVREVYMLINKKWLESWEKYVGYDNTGGSGVSPGPIDNKDLVSNFEEFTSEPGQCYIKLSDDKVESVDYKFICEEAWNLLIEWYGGKYQGGYAPTIARFSFHDSLGMNIRIDTKPLYIEGAVFNQNPTLQKFMIFRVFKAAKIKEMMKVLVEQFFKGEEPDNFRLWSCCYNNPYQRIENEDVEMEYQVEKKEGTQFLLEKKSEDGTWHLDFVKNYLKKQQEKEEKAYKSRSSYDNYYSGSSYSYSSNYFRTNSGNNSKPVENGVVGLSNLGNTCFMNSALQCLTKTTVFKDYFSKDYYVNEINFDNPLGMKGKIAESFGNLMKEMWSGKHSIVTPREFKYQIGNFAPQFSGYNQQDSAELIAYLLDGLHEDLNRIYDKPNTQMIEGSGRDNDAVANESWENHKKRNNSIIVDKFQGQFRSELQCPHCHKLSVTFDPFMYISVPVPFSERKKKVEVCYISNGNEVPPKKYLVRTSNGKGVNVMVDQFFEQTGIKPGNTVCCDVYSGRVYKYYGPLHVVKIISKNDKTFIYKVDDDADLRERDGVYPFCQVKFIMKTKTQYTDRITEKELLDYPFVFVLSKKIKEEEKKEEEKKEEEKKEEENKEENNEKDKNKKEKKKKPPHKVLVKEVYEKCYNICKRYFKEDVKEKLKEELKIDLDDPTTCFPCGNDDSEKKVLFKLLWNKIGSQYMNSSEYVDIIYDQPEQELIIPPQMKTSYSYFSSNSTDRSYKFKLLISDYIIPYIKQEEFEKIEKDEKSYEEKEKVERKSEIDIKTCLNLFCEKETLGKNDAWYCPNCKKHVQATKKIDIWKLPEVLVIQIKRFQNSGYYREKLDTFVNYPMNLDMSKISINTKNEFKKFKLYAVSNHFGGLGGGHYTAYARVQDQWYEFDDSSTSSVTPDRVVSSSGYVLFYIAENSKNGDDVVKEMEEKKKKKESEEKSVKEEKKEDKEGDVAME